MTKFLINAFIGKNADVSDAKVRSKYASLAGGVGILLNVLLFAGKLTLGILSASVAIIADAFNNISDAGSSLIALIGFRLASKPVDKEHPLGHGRMEYVSGFIVDMLIILVGFELFKSSLDKILSPTLPTVGNATLLLLSIAILVKVWLFFFYRKIGKTINAAAIKASATDSLTDCIATALVLISALVARFFQVAVDGYVGILVALFIAYTGIRAAKETIDLLLGSTPDPAFIKDIYEFTKNYPRIVGIHDVMVHDYGVGRQIVSFHAEVPSDSDINIAHEEVDKLEKDMREKFGCIVTVHLDPLVVNDPLVNELKALAETSAREVNEGLTIHDFRMTKGETNINLIFDLLLPADCPLTAVQAEKAVSAKIREANGHCSCVINAEYPFV
ncbi:MAG: cation transporter [Clostridia bacterium]|nr:cation transporter [Clostridia bacterium]